jgi:Protein of unknown function (DUF2721)
MHLHQRLPADSSPEHTMPSPNQQAGAGAPGFEKAPSIRSLRASSGKHGAVSLELNTPALVFPAGSFLMLAYTNRYLALASLIRNLVAEWQDKPHQRIEAQIRVLRQRVNMIRFMQTSATISMLLCLLSMGAVYTKTSVGGGLFLGGLTAMAISVLASVLEIQLSTKALNLQLELMEENRTGTANGDASDPVPPVPNAVSQPTSTTDSKMPS